MPFPFLLVDPGRRVLAANSRAHEELAGRSLASLLGQEELPEGLDGRELVLPCGTRARLAERPLRWEGVACGLLTWYSLGLAGSTKAASAPAGGRILVADDEESIRDICQRVLMQAGYQVTAVSDGQAAINLLAQDGAAFDLVLADMVMPVAGGEAIYDYLRQENRDLPVIFATGYALLETTPRDVTVLRKPFTLTQLLETVKSTLSVRTGGNPP